MDDGGTANGGVDTSPPQMFTIDVTAVNDPPSFVTGADETVLEDSGAQNVTAWVTSISPGPADESGQTISFNVSNNNNALFLAQPAINAAGDLSYTPADDANGSAIVTVEAMDDGGTANGGEDTSDPQMFTITVTAVNDAPSFTPGANETVDEDAGPQSVPTWATAISAGPPDESGQIVTFNVVNDNNALFLVQPAIDSAGTLSYTAEDDASGVANVTVEAMDDGGTANGGADTSPPENFTITVNAVNDPPVNTVPGPQSLLEDETLTFSAGNGNPMMVSDIDATNMAVQISVTSGVLTVVNVGGAIVSNNSTPTVDVSGTLADVNSALEGVVYAPDVDYFGPDVLMMSSDDSGETGSGGAQTDVDTVDITVDPVNDAPSFTAGANEMILEDAGAQSVPAWATAILAGPANEAGQTVSFDLSNDNNALFSSQPAVDSAGTLTYTPADHANGIAFVAVNAMDDGGTANGGVDTSPVQMFTIEVTAVNDEPVLDPIGDRAVDEETLLSFTATASDPNDTPPHGLTFSLSGEPMGAAITPTGDFTFTPTEAQGPNMYTFDVIVTDDGTPNEMDMETITVTVNEVNQAPVLDPIGNMMIDELSLLMFTATANDLDDPAQTLTFTLSGAVPMGAMITAGGVFSWTPTEAQGPGMYTFDVVVTDDGPGLLFDSETITIDVAEVNLPPMAGDDAYDSTGNVGINVAVGSGLLINDNDPDSVGAITVTAETVASGMGGSATLAADGSFTYDPPAGFTGMDTFSYTLNDNDPMTNMTDTGTVTITVVDMIWFIDNNVAGPGTGTLADPFAAIATYEGSGLPAASECIFIEETGNGAYTGPLTLDDGDTLIGNGASGTLDAQCGIILPMHSNSPPAIAGTRPQIDSAGNGINLGSGNTIRGLNVRNTIGTGVIGGAVGSLAISDTSIIGTGPAFDVGTSGTFGGNVAFGTLQCTTSSAVECLRLVSVSGTMTVGSGGSGLNHTGAANVVTIQGGSVSFTYPGTISKTAGTGSAIRLDNSHTGTVTFSSSVTANSGNGIQGNNADGAYNFNGDITLNGGDAGIDIESGSAGTFTFTGLGSTINNPSGVGLRVDASSATVTYPGSITKTNNTSNAVSVTTNSGTVTLSGTINASTTTGSAFVANGGGTINVTGTGSTITTTTATAVNIANTTIGASGVTFQSVSSNGGANPGIILNNTGTSGGLTITGDAGVTVNGSGGTIQSKTGDGIQLTDTMNFAMDQLNMTGIGNNGVLGIRVNGFSATNATYNNMGDADPEDVFHFNRDTLGDNGLIGTAVFQNLEIDNFAERGIDIVNEGSGTLDLDILDVDMDNNNDGFGEDAIKIQNEGSVNADVLVSGGIYDDIELDVLAYFAQSTGSNNVVVTDITSTNGGGPNNAPNGGGIAIIGSRGTTTFDINDNSLTGVQGEGVQIIGLPGAGLTVTLNGTIGGANVADGNTITSDNADGIDLDFDGATGGSSTVNGTITVRNNTINFDDDGIGVDFRDAGGTMNVIIQDNTLTGIVGTDAVVDTDDGIFIFTDDDEGAPESNLNLEILNNTVNDIEAADHVIVVEDVQNGNNVCLDLQGTSSNIAGADIELDTDATADLNVVQTSAGNLSTANNSISVANLGAGANFGGSVDCIP